MASSFYDEIEIEDFTFNPDTELYSYPCPCGDQFEISLDQLIQGDEVATCPSCSLIIRVIYDLDDFQSDNESYLLTNITESLSKIAV